MTENRAESAALDQATAPVEASPPRRERRPLDMWRSRLSWRITLIVFLTILLVQAMVMVSTARVYERQQLQNLRQEAQAAITTAIGDNRDQLASPIDDKTAQTLISSGVIQGFVVYALDHGLLMRKGGPTVLRPAHSPTALQTYRHGNGSVYEVLLGPDDLSRPYFVAVRIDASRIAPLMKAHVRQTLLILLLLSSFVTSVLMLALGAWLLTPIMQLRHNLLSAARNPERPDLERPDRETRDEIGLTLRIANDLIRQNAHNLRRLRTQAENRIHRLAYFDPLTGLPNRTFFLEKLDEGIREHVLKEKSRLAVLSIDIDHFKDINDTMGHEIGDRLLEAVGRRLVKALPPETLIARASADEFMIMLRLSAAEKTPARHIDAILAAMADPVSIFQERFQVRISIGVAQAPGDGNDARQIVKCADIALNRAKEEGRDTVRHYSQDLDLAVQQRFQTLRDLRVALEKNQLQLYYHPQFDLATGRMIGVEALLRWWRPDNSKEGGSFISPAEFIPIAEQSGLIVPISEWVLKTACATNKAWQDMGIPPFRMAVNISGVQFHRGDVVQQVKDALNASRLDPRWLELEVTESVFMENVETAIAVLDKLHKMGCELAVDDFGTGYSSLSYLRQFPIDRLKIDQSFVRDALVNPGDRVLARTIITLGHSLNLKVIAEGVETSDHEAFLREEGCDEVQGFKYTAPLNAKDMTAYARTHFGTGGARLSVVTTPG